MPVSATKPKAEGLRGVVRSFQVTEDFITRQRQVTFTLAIDEKEIERAGGLFPFFRESLAIEVRPLD